MPGSFHIHSATCVLSEHFSILKKRRLRGPYLNSWSQLYLHAECRYIGKKKGLISYNLIYYNFTGFSKIIWNSCCTYCTVDCTPPWLNKILLYSVLPKFIIKLFPPSWICDLNNTPCSWQDFGDQHQQDSIVSEVFPKHCLNLAQLWAKLVWPIYIYDKELRAGRFRKAKAAQFTSWRALQRQVPFLRQSGFEQLGD